MMQDWLLTPDDIDSTPELAALAVLDTALQVTNAAMISLHPDLRSPDDQAHYPIPGDDTGVVRTLLLLADALSDQISIYCQALRHKQRRELQRIADRDF